MRRLAILILVVCAAGLGAAALAAVDPLADRAGERGREAVERATGEGREAVERATGEGREAAGRAARRGRRAVEEPPRVRKARCPAQVDGCRAVRGRVVYVEAVDPDGDGDLHVVVADGGITAPGLTSVDVRPGLRPRRDPRAGDVVTAAGPVQRGSIGQSQIHALEFRVGRAG